jgi:putative transposase
LRLNLYRDVHYKNYKSDVLNQEFWLEKTFWSDGYFACSIGEASPDTIREYILNQG